MNTISRCTRTVLLGVLATQGLIACSTQRAQETIGTPAPTAWQLSLKPPLPGTGGTRRISQLVTITHAGDSATIPFYIELSAESLVMTAIASWGGPLFSVRYDGKQVSVVPPQVEIPGLEPEYILADFILTYWPLSALVPALNEQGITVREDTLLRSVESRDRTLIEIRYSQEQRWQSAVSLFQKELNYQISITPVAAKQ
ncbi:MAG: DUF3261 domain-containing protein [Gammaproteobacteria bacterium]|nr:DUF3261 domain-containing protein [Gammaproteobacteria bacterium]